VFPLKAKMTRKLIEKRGFKERQEQFSPVLEIRSHLKKPGVIAMRLKAQ